MDLQHLGTLKPFDEKEFALPTFFARCRIKEKFFPSKSEIKAAILIIIFLLMNNNEG